MLMYPQGDEYEGQLFNERKHGTGMYTYANGTTLKGSWINDKRQGEFVMIIGNEKTIENWDDGWLVNSKRLKFNE